MTQVKAEDSFPPFEGKKKVSLSSTQFRVTICNLVGPCGFGCLLRTWRIVVLNQSHLLQLTSLVCICHSKPTLITQTIREGVFLHSRRASFTWKFSAIQLHFQDCVIAGVLEILEISALFCFKVDWYFFGSICFMSGKTWTPCTFIPPSLITLFFSWDSTENTDSNDMDRLCLHIVINCPGFGQSLRTTFSFEHATFIGAVTISSAKAPKLWSTSDSAANRSSPQEEVALRETCSCSGHYVRTALSEEDQ